MFNYIPLTRLSIMELLAIKGLKHIKIKKDKFVFLDLNVIWPDSEKVQKEPAYQILMANNYYKFYNNM